MAERTIAGRYDLERLLGRSSMAEVWLANDRELGRPVALKLLAVDGDAARFEREARAVAALDHPNVTKLYDYGTLGDRAFISFEYLDGRTLEDRLREVVRLPDGETVGIAGEIAAGLAHAHSRGVVHRDLKPANVLFDDEGTAKLGDFGIARLSSDTPPLTETGTLLGTPAYISPEQAAGEAAGPWSDVYSFGVVLFRMLAGRLPFESQDPFELARLHREAVPPAVSRFRSDAPPQLAATVAAALEKDPGSRPRDGEALLVLLGAARPMPGLPVSLEAQTTRVLPRPAREPVPGRRLHRFLVPLLLLLAAGGAALAWGLTRLADAPPAKDGPRRSLVRSPRRPPVVPPSATTLSTPVRTHPQALATTTPPPTTAPAIPVLPPTTTTVLPPTTTARPTTTAPITTVPTTSTTPSTTTSETTTTTPATTTSPATTTAPLP